MHIRVKGNRQIGIHVQFLASRKHLRMHFRDNIIRNAESLHSDGLDSRIPFLRYALLNEGSHGSTARREDGIPVPDWEPGEEPPQVTICEVHRFNIFNVENGIQALKIASLPGEGARVKVLGCKTSLIGDLRISVVPEGSEAYVPHGAMYQRILNQVLVSEKIADGQAFFAHEIEHARHINLELMSSPFEVIYMSTTDPINAGKMEYMAMLAETFGSLDIPMVNILIGNKMTHLIDRELWPHLWSSAYFVSRLVFKYGMKPSEVLDANNAWKQALKGDMEKLDNPNIEKIRKFAKQEYERAYEKLFGLAMEEIKEIVADLPDI